MIKDFSNVNPNDFTQKDLMLHLLQVSQHTVTREEVKDDISQVDKKLDKVESNIIERFDVKIDKVDAKIDKVEASLREDMHKLDVKIDKVDAKIDKVEASLREDMHKLDVKIDKVDAKIDKVEASLREDMHKLDVKIDKVETSLKEDNKDLAKRIDRFMFWSLGLSVSSTFLILTLMYKMMPK